MNFDIKMLPLPRRVPPDASGVGFACLRPLGLVASQLLGRSYGIREKMIMFN